jgi:hypothetical protein
MTPFSSASSNDGEGTMTAVWLLILLFVFFAFFLGLISFSEHVIRPR